MLIGRKLRNSQSSVRFPRIVHQHSRAGPNSSAFILFGTLLSVCPILGFNLRTVNHAVFNHASSSRAQLRSVQYFNNWSRLHCMSSTANSGANMKSHRRNHPKSSDQSTGQSVGSAAARKESINNRNPKYPAKKFKSESILANGTSDMDVDGSAADDESGIIKSMEITAHTQSRTSSSTLSQMTNVSFKTLAIRNEIKRGISEAMGYELMTKVQEASIPVALSGVDVLAKAKTGTGKTLSFLIPCVERISQHRSNGPRGISVLIISPTRELAQQIFAEAEVLTKFLNLNLQCIFGGTNVATDLKLFQTKMPDILVATPGRLIDHLSNNSLDKKMNLCSLVFDEADQLLEMGFRPAIEQILSFLPPPSTRQTLLYSATMPKNIQEMAKIAMRPQYSVVDTVGEEESTHEHVPQSYILTDSESITAQLLFTVKKAMIAGGKSYKIIVFFTVVKLTHFYSELFRELGVNVLEMHSKKSQAYRTRISEEFRSSSGLIMFSSDVSARGMDYPDVTSVIQVGMPSDRDQYIHRLGRTARAGKSGNGILILCDFEKTFLDEVRELPLVKHEGASIDQIKLIQNDVESAISKVSIETKESASRANLGYLNSCQKRCSWNKSQIVNVGKEWACMVAGLEDLPPFEARTLGKMGMKNVPGLRVCKVIRGNEGSNQGSRGRAPQAENNSRAPSFGRNQNRSRNGKFKP